MYRLFQLSKQCRPLIRGLLPLAKTETTLPKSTTQIVRPIKHVANYLPESPKTQLRPKVLSTYSRQPFHTLNQLMRKRPKRHLQTLPPPVESNTWRFAFFEDLTGGAILALYCYTLYTLYQRLHAPRETPIIASPISIDSPSYDETEDTTTPHGSLTNRIIGYQGKTFIKKGAKNKDALIREFAIGDALHEMYPNTQPQSLLFHQKLDEKRAQYFTLSEKRPGSIDIEDFIKSGWEEKLKEKPLLGFERTLAMVGIIAGQQDCKFANMIIIDKPTHYEAALIDHELSGKSFWLGLNRHTLTHDFTRLASMIRDLQDPHDDQFGAEFKFGLTNDPRGKAFIEYVKDNSMDTKQLDAFYLKLSNHDFTPTIERLQQLSSLSNLITEKDVKFWQNEFDTWKCLAKKYCADKRLIKNQPEHDKSQPAPSLHH